MTKTHVCGAAAVAQAKSAAIHALILKLLADKPMSAADLAAEGVAHRRVCSNYLTRMRRGGLAVSLIRLPVPTGGAVAYYRKKDTGRPDDVGYCELHHAYIYRTPGKVAPRVRLAHEDDEVAFEAHIKEEASAKSKKVVPFRCAMTEAFFGPYVRCSE